APYDSNCFIELFPPYLKRNFIARSRPWCWFTPLELMRPKTRPISLPSCAKLAVTWLIKESSTGRINWASNAICPHIFFGGSRAFRPLRCAVMINKPLDAIEEADLSALTADRRIEDRTIEYKFRLPDGADDEERKRNRIAWLW